MRKCTILILIVMIAISSISCQQSAKQARGLTGALPNDGIFQKGNKITNNNFSGIAWLNSLVEADTSNNTQVGSVTFEPGARTNWHYHPGGQILLILEGKGLYQEKGKPVEVINKGDVMKCPPNIHHWHGATPTDTLVHVAITDISKGRVVWLAKVSDDEYWQNVKL